MTLETNLLNYLTLSLEEFPGVGKRTMEVRAELMIEFLLPVCSVAY